MDPVLTSEAMNLSIHSFSDKIFDLGKLELCVWQPHKNMIYQKLNYIHLAIGFSPISRVPCHC